MFREGPIKKRLDKIVLQQKKAIRVVLGAPYNCHTLPFFKILQFDDLYKCSLIKVGNLIARPLHNTPKGFLECFKIQPTTTTRSNISTNLVIPFCKLENLKKLCSHQVPYLYNSLNHIQLDTPDISIVEIFKATCYTTYEEFECLRKKCYSCRK